MLSVFPSRVFVCADELVEVEADDEPSLDSHPARPLNPNTAHIATAASAPSFFFFMALLSFVSLVGKYEKIIVFADYIREKIYFYKNI